MNLRIFDVVRTRLILGTRGVRVTGQTRFVGRPPILSIVGQCILGRSVVFRGAQHRTQITVSTGAKLVVGDYAFVNQGVNIFASERVEIGRFAKIGDGVAISDSTFHPVGPNDTTESSPVVIGENVWIGRAAMILPGVNLGDNVVVGAGSVVTKSVPANTVVAGAPAKKIRDIEATAAKWVRA